MSLNVTTEGVQRVREQECEHHGHIYTAVTTSHSQDPEYFLCVNCDRSWRVVPAEEMTDDQLEEGAR